MKYFYVLLGFTLLSVSSAMAQCSADQASAEPTICINTALSQPITHTTAEATGIGTPIDLPSGVTASWANDEITIDGTPTESGVFNYQIPLLGMSCAGVSATGTITVSSPTADAGPTLPAICQEEQSDQMGGSVSGGATGGTWAGGQGTWTNANNPSNARYTAGASESGPVTLTLTTTGGSCGSTTATKDITVNNPTANAGPPTPAICQEEQSDQMGGSVSGGATGGTWTADGQGTWTNANNPSTARYTAGASESGPVTLTLTTTGGSCGVDIATKNITVNENPTALAGPALSAICQEEQSDQMGGSVGGGATGGTWTGGLGTWTNENNPSTARYTADASESGPVTLTLTTTGGSCGTITATKDITVNENPTAFSGPALSAICQEEQSDQMGGSVGGGATGGTWTGGLGTWTNENNPSTARYTAGASESGTVTLTLTTNGGSCGTITATKDITVNENPTANAGQTLQAICQETMSAQMLGSVGGGAVGGTWTANGTGTWTNANNPSSARYTAGASESGTVTLTLTTIGGSCGTITATKNIMVNSNPTANAGGDLPAICQDEQSMPMGGSVGGGATSGTWTANGTGTWANANNPSSARYTAGASESGTVTLTLSTSNEFCNRTVSKNILVNANPTAIAGSSLPAICQEKQSDQMGGSVGGGATGGTWTGGLGTWTNENNPSTARYTAGASESGQVTLTLTTSGGECGTTTATKVITVDTLPIFNFINPITEYCEGTSLEISVSDLDLDYTWSIDGVNSTVGSNTISANAEVGDSQVAVRGVDGNGCENFQSLDITVFIDYDVSFNTTFDSGYLLCTNESEVDYVEAITILPNPSVQDLFQVPDTIWTLDGDDVTSLIDPNVAAEGINRNLQIDLVNGACPADSATAQVLISILSLPDVDPVLEITDYCEGDLLELCVTENVVATNSNSQLNYAIAYPINANAQDFSAATNGLPTCLGPDGTLEIPTIFTGVDEENQQEQNLSLNATYTYTINDLVKPCSLAEFEELTINDVTRAYQPEFTTVLDGPFCQEGVVDIKSEDIISNPNVYPFDQENLTNQFNLQLEGNSVSGDVGFGVDFDAIFSNPAVAPLDPGVYTLTYQLDFGSCERSITDTFDIRPFPEAVNIQFELCEDTLEVISLESIVNQSYPDYQVFQDTLFTVSQSDSSLIALEDGQFIVNTDSITADDGLQTITFNYEADTSSIGLFTILDSNGCMVPDNDQLRVRIMPEIEAFLTTELYFCETINNSIGLDSIQGGNGEFYDYQWQINGVNLDQGESIMFDLEDTQAQQAITRTLRIGAPIVPGGPAVCRADTSVTVTINNFPINAVLSDDAFSSYCSEESTTFSIENWTRAEGFTVDSAEILFFDNPPPNTDAIPGLTPVNIPGWTFWQDNADMVSFMQTLSPGDYPGGSPSLPNDINYVTGFYLNPIHNCNTYEAAGVNFPYIASTSTSQPFPQILSASSNQVCPGGVITLEATADSSATNQWNIQPNLAFTPNENDPMNSIDVTIPTNLIGTTIIVNLNQESSGSGCLGTDADTLIFNSNGLSPGSKDYFIDPVSDFIIYNDSGLCYQWGLIETIVADGVPMNVFTEFEGQNFQSFELDIRPELDPEDILCKVSFKENGVCPADPDCFTIAPKRLGTGNPVVIEPQSSDILWLYPNPNNGQFSVALNDLIPDRRYSLEVYNYLGQPIWQESFVSEREDYVRPITMPNVANGMYSLRMLIEDRPIARLSFILNR